MKNTKPGYFNEKPIIAAISELRATVGHQDSCIQTNQVALLFLEESADASEDKRLFLHELFKKFRISLGTSDFDFSKSIQYKSYILQTYNLIEPFFKSLNSSYRYYNNFQGHWKTKRDDKNLDPFNQLLENIEQRKAENVIKYPEYNLLEYYRLIRNSIVHLQENEDEHKRTSKYFDDNLKNNLEHFHLNYELNAPNRPEEIDFHDFMLYTRAIKYFSNILNDLCFPDLNDFVIVAKRDEDFLMKLRRFQDTESKAGVLRRINVMRSFFHKHFSIHHKDIRDEFCRILLEEEGTNYHDLL